MKSFYDTFHLSFHNLLSYLPALVGAVICLALTILIANLLSKLISRYSLKRTKDPLISNFIGKIIWALIFILGLILSLGILGLGTISNKILAGAGLTTFIVGFALKDIGENFLSGLILAFSRPYRVGNLIECEGTKGIVKDMTMRQTTVEAENGRIVLIPNSMILKNPLVKHANDDNNLRQEFSLNVAADQVDEATKLISDTVASFDFVLHSEDKPVKVVVDSLSGDKVKLLVVYWFDPKTFRGSKSGSRTEILKAVLQQLKAHNVKFSG